MGYGYGPDKMLPFIKPSVDGVNLLAIENIIKWLIFQASLIKLYARLQPK